MRRRNMYHATGLPGWMRFGFGRGRGGRPGPCAQFLMSGQWPIPQLAAAWQAMQGQPASPAAPVQLEALKAQDEMLEAQLTQLREMIAQLEPSEAPGESQPGTPG